MTVSLEQDVQVIRLRFTTVREVPMTTIGWMILSSQGTDGYNFIHFGMIQVAAKPLTRLGWLLLESYQSVWNYSPWFRVWVMVRL